MNSNVVDKIIKEWLKQKPQFCDIEIAGKIIGGRHAESMQDPVDFVIVNNILRIYLYPHDIVTIVNPKDMKLENECDLTIGSAEEVRFGWYYYGSEIKSENWCEEIFRKKTDHVEFIRISKHGTNEEKLYFDGEHFVYLGCMKGED